MSYCEYAAVTHDEFLAAFARVIPHPASNATPTMASSVATPDSATASRGRARRPPPTSTCPRHRRDPPARQVLDLPRSSIPSSGKGRSDFLSPSLTVATRSSCDPA
jgi:hypothetical protein